MTSSAADWHAIGILSVLCMVIFTLAHIKPRESSVLEIMSMLITMSTVPGLLGTQEAIRQSQSKDKREEHRARRCNFIAHCVKPSLRAREINDRPLVLSNGHVSFFPFLKERCLAPSLYALDVIGRLQFHSSELTKRLDFRRFWRPG